MSQKFEDIFKKRFEHLEADVDASMFDKIVEKRKRKSAVIWWRWAGWTAAVIALIVLSKVVYDSQTSSPAIDDQPLVEEQQDITGKLPEIQEDLNESTSPEDVVTDEFTPVETNSTIEVASEPVSRSQEYAANNNANSNWGNPREDMVEDEDLLEDVVENEPLQGDAGEAPTAITPDADLANNQGNDPADDAADNQEDDGQELAMDDQESDEPLEDEPSDDSDSDSELNTTVKTIRFVPSGWSFEITGGPGYAFRSLSGNPELTQWRNETESPALSYQANVAAIRALDNNWFFRAGLSFTQRNENFKFQHQNSLNSYTSIAVPVEMEKAFYIKKKWSISGRLGLVLRLHEFKSGYIRTSETDFEPISDRTVERSGYLATNFGMGVNYRVNQRLQLLMQPQWSHSTSSNFSDQNNLAHRDYGFFTRFGIRVDL